MDNYKSEGEKAIAEILNRYNIDFVYEHPLLINEQKENDTAKLRIWYPDFWLPKYSIVIEYWGKEGDEHYNRGKKAKMLAYKRLDIDCISVKRSTIQKDLKSYLLISIKRRINEKVRHFENRHKNKKNFQK